MNIEEKLGIFVKWSKLLNRMEVAIIEKNIEEDNQKTLTKEEIERFKKASKNVLAENGTICVYQIGAHIYVNRVRTITPGSSRITFQKIL
jgi:hypothetical protein